MDGMASARGLKDELWYRYDINSFQSGLIVSASLFGALAGSSAAFVVGDKLGRRRELLLAAALYGKFSWRRASSNVFACEFNKIRQQPAICCTMPCSI